MADAWEKSGPVADRREERGRVPFPGWAFGLGVVAWTLPLVSHAGWVLADFWVWLLGVLALFFFEAGNGLAKDYYDYRAFGPLRPGLFTHGITPQPLVLKGAWGSHLLAFLFVLLLSMRLGFEGWQVVAWATVGFFTGYYAHAEPFDWDRSFAGRCLSALSCTAVPFLISSIVFDVALNALNFWMILSVYLLWMVAKQVRRESHLIRYTTREFPPYGYVPGRFPHPHRDPEGHSHGLPAVSYGKTDPGEWRRTEAYLYAVDLFNAGYYWEAHESWEGLWKELSPQSDHALFLQGLIQLAAASLKYQLSNKEGVRRLFSQATEKLQRIQKNYPHPYMGVDLNALMPKAMKTFASVQYAREGEPLPKFRPLTLVLG